MSSCPECGEAIVTGWAFCEACGAPTSAAAEVSPSAPPRRRQLTAEPSPAVGDADDAPVGAGSDPTVAIPAIAPGSDSDVVVPAASGGRRRPRGRQVLVGLGALVMLVALVVTALHILGTHDRLNRTRTQLASTEATLKATKGELASTKSDLDRTRSDLAARTSERDKLQGDLNLTTSNLNDARGKVDLQASVIEDLSDCLDGVAIAMVDMAGGYWESAVNELNRVEAACERAAEHV